MNTTEQTEELARVNNIVINNMKRIAQVESDIEIALILDYADSSYISSLKKGKYDIFNSMPKLRALYIRDQAG